MEETLDIPIFPLDTVLFPGGRLPLRIFEVRYVDMTKACIRRSIWAKRSESARYSVLSRSKIQVRIWRKSGAVGMAPDDGRRRESPQGRADNQVPSRNLKATLAKLRRTGGKP